MSHEDRGDPVDRYLLDPSSPPAQEVVDLERALLPLRYRPRPLALPRALREAPHSRSPHRRTVAWLAAAAAVLLLAGSGVAAWVWSWPAGRPWPVLAGAPKSLPVGDTVRLSGDEEMLVRVARIGWMQVAGGSDVTLLATASNAHRLALTAGSVQVGIWAPPGSLSIRTPAGLVIDLGCEFRLTVESAISSVEVLSGWVQLDNGWGESLVPAGAAARMAEGREPSVPVFRDADPRFQGALAAFEGAGDTDLLPAIVATARQRDVFSLLVLATRTREGAELLVDRAAELAPPASAGLVARARRGDRQAIWTWIGELPLPPPKTWLPNWRDRWVDGGKR